MESKNTRVILRINKDIEIMPLSLMETLVRDLCYTISNRYNYDDVLKAVNKRPAVFLYEFLLVQNCTLTENIIKNYAAAGNAFVFLRDERPALSNWQYVYLKPVDNSNYQQYMLLCPGAGARAEIIVQIQKNRKEYADREIKEELARIEECGKAAKEDKQKSNCFPISESKLPHDSFSIDRADGITPQGNSTTQNNTTQNNITQNSTAVEITDITHCENLSDYDDCAEDLY